MPLIPRDKNLDSTLALGLEGYNFISNRCRRYGTDVFQARLLGQPTLCLRGAEAAQLFYDNERFIRQGAAPKRAQKTLFGQGGVQGLDDNAHRARKQLFMSLMTPENINQLSALTASQWHASLKNWERQTKIVLFDEVQEMLCRTVCQWAGVPLPESQVPLRTNEMAAMIESGGTVGPPHWRGRFARKRAERWGAEMIDAVREGTLEVPEGCALNRIARYRELDGVLLDSRTAAVELLNVLRPTVAVARYVIFVALALHRHPEHRQQLEAGQSDDFEFFAQEVRRYYPFFPLAAARTRKSFVWKGYIFPKGIRVLLDLYGTNHDARLWQEPERFRLQKPDAFNLIPQGGGNPHSGHRCPGEAITLEIMKVALDFLACRMQYVVPKQDLGLSLSRMPALPNSRFVISQVRSRR